MPAKSKAQHGLMGMALAVRRGKMKIDEIPARVRTQVTRLARDKSINLEEFTTTPTKNLPRRVKKPTVSAIRTRRK